MMYEISQMVRAYPITSGTKASTFLSATLLL